MKSVKALELSRMRKLRSEKLLQWPLCLDHNAPVDTNTYTPPLPPHGVLVAVGCEEGPAPILLGSSFIVLVFINGPTEKPN